jgi:hypothetical protein
MHQAHIPACWCLETPLHGLHKNTASIFKEACLLIRCPAMDVLCVRMGMCLLSRLAMGVHVTIANIPKFSLHLIPTWIWFWVVIVVLRYIYIFLFWYITSFSTSEIILKWKRTRICNPWNQKSRKEIWIFMQSVKPVPDPCYQLFVWSTDDKHVLITTLYGR